MTIIRSFQRRDRVEPTLPPAVDLDGLEATLRAGQELAAYAPKRNQASDLDRAVRTVASFGELPAREIDEAITALREELIEIEADAQRVRDAYCEVTARLMKHVERQRAVHGIARSAFAAMRDGCAALEQPELPFTPPQQIPDQPTGETNA